jgi:hypothetical protein
MQSGARPGADRVSSGAPSEIDSAYLLKVAIQSRISACFAATKLAVSANRLPRFGFGYVLVAACRFIIRLFAISHFHVAVVLHSVHHPPLRYVTRPTNLIGLEKRARHADLFGTFLTCPMSLCWIEVACPSSQSMVTPLQDTPTTVPRSVVVTPQQTRAPTASARDSVPVIAS